MRERRGNLRDWGYAFRTDGPVHSFAATLHILEENMVVRREMTPPAPQRVTLAEIETARAQDFFTTRSDLWGLRLNVRDGALHIAVVNPVAADDTPAGAHGVGLKNIRERLAVLYGPRARIGWQRSETQFAIEIHLPVDKETGT